jgi:hypothetical protein
MALAFSSTCARERAHGRKYNYIPDKNSIQRKGGKERVGLGFRMDLESREDGVQCLGNRGLWSRRRRMV